IDYYSKMQRIVLNPLCIGRHEQRLTLDAGMSDTVEAGVDLPHGAGGDRFLGLFRYRTPAAWSDLGDHQRGTAGVPEAKRNIQVLAFRDGSEIPRRIQPLDGRIPGGVPHDLLHGNRPVVAYAAAGETQHPGQKSEDREEVTESRLESQPEGAQGWHGRFNFLQTYRFFGFGCQNPVNWL